MTLYDAYLLAESLKTNGNLTDILKNYEEQKFEITKFYAKESQDNLEIFFSKMVQKKWPDFYRDGQKAY